MNCGVRAQLVGDFLDKKRQIDQACFLSIPMLMPSAQTLPHQPDASFFATARLNMVESQLRPNKILDARILNLMGSLAREEFVAPHKKSFAYSDDQVEVGAGRFMLAPMVLARMLEELGITPSCRILHIGAATGYVSALLNELAGEVIALESDQALLRQLQQNKQRLQLDHVLTAPGSLHEGYPPASPYHAIFIDGGVQYVPEKLTAQLAEPGRLICVYYPEGDVFGTMGVVRLYEKNNGAVTHRPLCDAAAPLLPGFKARPRFSFF